MKRDDLTAYLDQLLETTRFRDYSPNGLQVEGRPEIARIVTGVTASLELIETAIAQKADAIIVHHGWFWKGEDGRVTGYKKERMQQLLAHDINLIAYHLPLDAHAEFGNNAQFGQQLGCTIDGRFADQEIGYFGKLPATTTLGALSHQIARLCQRIPLTLGDTQKPVQRIAWCSGGAQGFFEQALALGADVYISGEVSEQTFHMVNETGMAYIAAGHHATERFGIQSLTEHLKTTFNLAGTFVDLVNPV